MTKVKSFLCLSLALLTACISTKVKVDESLQFDSVSNKSFAWADEPMKPTGRNSGFYDLDNSLRKTVTRTLTKKGYQQVAKADADFLVDYRFFQEVSLDQGGIISPTDEAAAVNNPSLDMSNNEVYNHYIPDQIKMANMRIILLDSGTNDALWRVDASKVVESQMNDSSAIREAVQKIIPGLLADLPVHQ
jgi:hypothetical protein